MKKILLFLLMFLAYFSTVNANYIDKKAVKTSQWNFDVVMKTTNDYLNIKDNNISNQNYFNWYFLSKDINWKYVDLWSYWQPSLKIWSGYNYLLSSFYILTPYQQNIKIKSFVKWTNEAIEDSLGSLYTTYNPTYLAYIAVWDAKAYSWTYNLNEVLKNYIDNLSYSDRVSLIQEIDSDWCKYISTLSLKICGFQKNPTKITTEQTYSGYQNINWYKNDTSFLSNDITLQTWYDITTIWFIRDLYNGFNSLDSYNSSTWIQISFSIQWGYIFPAFLWQFKDFFINDINALLKEWFNFNDVIWNLLKYYKAKWLSIWDLYTRDFINDWQNEKLYKYWIWYIELDKKINDNVNKWNWLYYFSNYIVNGSQIYFWENFSNTIQSDVVVSKTNNDLLFCWSNTDDNYVNTNKKLHNTDVFSFKKECSNLPDTTVSLWNLTLHKFYFWNNTSDEYRTFFNIAYNQDNTTILLWFNNPIIFNRIIVPKGIHSITYIPNKYSYIQNLSEKR